MKVNFQSGLSSGHSLSPVEETNQVTLQSLKINWLVETIVAACGKCGIMKTERSPAIKSHDEHSMHERIPTDEARCHETVEYRQTAVH